MKDSHKFPFSGLLRLKKNHNVNVRVGMFSNIEVWYYEQGFLDGKSDYRANKIILLYHRSKIDEMFD